MPSVPLNLRESKTVSSKIGDGEHEADSLVQRLFLVRARMAVDDVKKHADAHPMSGVDKRDEGFD